MNLRSKKNNKRENEDSDSESENVQHPTYKLRPRKNIKSPERYRQKEERNVSDLIAEAEQDIIDDTVPEYEIPESYNNPYRSKGGKGYTIPDFNPKKLKKEFQRPYFSPKRNSYEIDLMFCRYKSVQQIYAIIININTKYLIVKPIPNRNENTILNLLRSVLEEVKINNIRGDYEGGWISRRVLNFLEKVGINYYFTNKQFTNRNRVVDRVIRTLRDMFDNAVGIDAKHAMLNPEFMDEIVETYNTTKHSAFKNKFTPEQVQNNPSAEIIFIRKHMIQLEEVKKKQFQQDFSKYQEGNIILINIPDKYNLVKKKKRRNFQYLAEFVRYQNGNVVCSLLTEDNSFINGEEIVVPIYHTKYICDNFLELQSKNKFREYFKYF
jgi:hypothetical protein